MIFKIFILLLVLACLIYYVFCFLEVFGLVKFTPKNIEITFPKALIPFYYLFKKEKPSTKNKNGKIYTNEEYEKHIAYLKKNVESESTIGELEHPENQRGDKEEVEPENPEI